MVSNNLKYDFITALQVFVLLVITAVHIWASNKGIDISDEGFYLLGFQEKQELGLIETYFQALARFYFPFIENSVIGWRIIRLLLSGLSAYVLVYGIIKWLKQWFVFSTFETINAYLFVIVGSFTIPYLFGPQTLSYNSLSGIFVVFAVGLFFITLTAKSLKLAYTIFFLIGIMLANLLISKITAGILLSFLFSLVTLFYFWGNFKKIFLIHLAVIGGIASFYILFFLFIFSFELYSNSLLFFANEGKHQNYQNVALVGYVFDAAKQILKIFIYAFVITASFVFGEILLKNNKIARFIATFFALLGTIVLVFYKFFLTAKLDSSFIILWLFVVLLYSLFFTFQEKKPFFYFKGKKEFLLITIFLFLVPLSCAFGSDTGLLRNSLFYTTLYFGWLLIFYKTMNLKKTAVLLSIFVGITLSSVSYIRANVFFPYRADALFLQTESLQNITGINLKVDKNTALFVRQLKETLVKNGFQDNDYILMFDQMAGVVFLMNGRAPGGNNFAHWKERLEKNLKFREMNDVKFICIANIKKISQDIINVLKNNDINFPDSYQKVDSVVEGRHNWVVDVYKMK